VWTRPSAKVWAFADEIDWYRQFSRPANLAGKRVISNELGAVQNAAYRYLLSSLVFSANRGLAGGVNQYVIHGQSYTGNYYATSWPGCTAFGAVSTLQQYAGAGLPVHPQWWRPWLLSPQRYGGTRADFASRLLVLMSSANVHQVAAGRRGVAGLVSSLWPTPSDQGQQQQQRHLVHDMARIGGTDGVDYAVCVL